jgi:hypothetical protein
MSLNRVKIDGNYNFTPLLKQRCISTIKIKLKRNKPVI